MGFKKNYAVFLLGKRIGGGITASDITDKSNNESNNKSNNKSNIDTTGNKCGTANATVDKRGRTFETTVYAIQNPSIVITVPNVVQCGDLWFSHSWLLLWFFNKVPGLVNIERSERDLWCCTVNTQRTGQQPTVITVPLVSNSHTAHITHCHTLAETQSHKLYNGASNSVQYI